MTYQQAVEALIVSAWERYERLQDGETSLLYPGEEETLKEALIVASEYLGRKLPKGFNGRGVPGLQEDDSPTQRGRD